MSKTATMRPNTTAPALAVRSALAVTAMPPGTRKWRTPNAMLAWIGAVAAGTAVAGVVTFAAIGDVRNAVTTIGLDTKPSIVASMQARTYMAELDAAAANEAITGTTGATVGLSPDYLTASRALDTILLSAAGNVTFGEAERKPLSDIQESMARYNQEIGVVRGIGDTNPWLMRHRVVSASRILREETMPAAEALERANLEPLDSVFNAFGSRVRFAEVELIGGFALLGAALVGMQNFFARRTRRLLNIPMVAASLITVCGLLVAPWNIVAGRNAVQSAKVDAFDSILSLSEVKAAVFKMNADESIWLMDTDGGRAASERSFSLSADRILHSADPAQARLLERFSGLAKEALERERAGNKLEATRRTPQFDGLLGKAMSNITFGVEEREAITDAMSAYLDYMRIDAQIRALERKGDHRGALDLGLGTAEGQSNWAFDRLTSALDKAIAVNDRHFEAEIGRTLRTMRWMPWATGGGLAAVFLLAAGGAWMRFREYR